jgi:AraC-like DNA-binding protein
VRKLAQWGRPLPQQIIRKAYGKVIANEIFESKDEKSKLIRLPKSKRLLAIAEYLIANPSDVRNLNYWAKEAGMSRKTFTRKFFAETRCPFGKWRRLLKAQTAFHRLGSGATVAEIADELGYQNPSAFTKAFKTVYKRTPGEVAKDRRLGGASDKATG